MNVYEYKVLCKPDSGMTDLKVLEKKCIDMEEELRFLGLAGWKLSEWKNGMMIFIREIEE